MQARKALLDMNVQRRKGEHKAKTDWKYKAMNKGRKIKKGKI